MSPETVQLTTIKGRPGIRHNALVNCNTRHHRPYLAVIDQAGEPVWQDKLYDGYGNRARVYYATDGLVADDLIKMAGGTGENKYPWTGRVIAISGSALEVQEIAQREFDNLVAARKKSGAGAETAAPANSRDALLARRAVLQAELAEIERDLAVLDALPVFDDGRWDEGTQA